MRMGRKNSLREKFYSNFGVASCNKKIGWIRMRNSVFWMERSGN